MFLAHIKSLPAEDIKVIIGDDLAAHMSSYVTELCAANNVHFCFLLENSTHLLQPLDVAVFRPMKWYWRDPAGLDGGLCSQKCQLRNAAQTGVFKAAKQTDAEGLQQPHRDLLVPF